MFDIKDYRDCILLFYSNRDLKTIIELYLRYCTACDRYFNSKNVNDETTFKCMYGYHYIDDTYAPSFLKK